MSEITSLVLDRDTVRLAADSARSGATEQVRERLLISKAVSLTIRNCFDKQTGNSTLDGRAADIRYSELLDVNDFAINNWFVEIRVVTNVTEMGLYVPTVPLMVGFLSHYYLCVQVDVNLSKVDVFGFASPREMASAELTPNGLMAYVPLDELKPFNELIDVVSTPRQIDPHSLSVFDDWQERASRLSKTMEALLVDESFSENQAERLVAVLHDEVLRLYSEFASPTGFESIFAKLTDRFNFDAPLRSRPESPITFANSQVEEKRTNASETVRKFFRDQLNLVRRIGLYRHLVESQEAFEKHRQTKQILDVATSGKAQSSKRKRDRVKRVGEDRSEAAHTTPIPPPVIDPDETEELAEWFAEFEGTGPILSCESPTLKHEMIETNDCLHNFPFKHEYRSSEDDLVNDFYVPSLVRTTEYCRAVGYFSSSSLESLGIPLGDFVARGGRMRLVTSVELSEDDYRAISDGTSRVTVVENRLLDQIAKEFRDPLGRGSELLLRLLEIGSLEIKIAMPTSGRGIYHEKVGIFSDATNYVAFAGSANESRNALEGNYECIDVYLSWGEENRAARKREHFESIWENNAIGVTVLEFPEAAKRQLIRIHERSREPKPVAEEIGDGLWKHQREAIDVFLQRRRGILEMATGSGKTFTALQIATQLVGKGAISSVIVVCEGVDLLDQWVVDLFKLGTNLSPAFRVLRHFKSFHDRQEFLNSPKNSVLAISRGALHEVLRRMTPEQKHQTLIIHDEVHGFGSPSHLANLIGLSDDFVYRLGLSATPEREYDEAGNDFIEQNVGEVIYRFPLDEAISRGILCEFDYYPLRFDPSDEDRERIQSVYKQRAVKKREGKPMSDAEFWTALARVYKLSRQKIPLFRDFLAEHSGVLHRSIIFVAEREYGEEILPIIHDHIHDFHTYYAEDDKENLIAFARGDISCLVTCHRLSEGIDVRSVRTIILLSSDKAKLETIQRVGRCLRIDPADPTKRAVVVDFIRNQDPDKQTPNADQERMAWLQSISEIKREVQHPHGRVK